LGERAKTGIVLQRESAAVRDTGFEKLVWLGSVVPGRCAEIGVVYQWESAAECDTGFAELAGPGWILVGEYAEGSVNVVAGRESRIVEFRQLSIW
jgi:hypothetical protein